MPQTHHPCSNLTLLILLTRLIWLIESYIKGKFKILSPEGTIEYAQNSFYRGNHRVCSKFFLPREPQSTLTILSPEGTIEYAQNSFSRGNKRVHSKFFLPRGPQNTLRILSPEGTKERETFGMGIGPSFSVIFDCTISCLSCHEYSWNIVHLDVKQNAEL